MTMKAGNMIELTPELSNRIKKSILKAVDYLKRNQSEDGAWLPLWFGNQLTTNKSNPVYGTAKVCTYLNDCISSGMRIPEEMILIAERARSYISAQQNDDGSWGAEKKITGTVEETSLAICALAGYNKDACLKAFEWLAAREKLNSAPIGLYFALLWYDEELYPVIYYTEALRRFMKL
jgi:squalene-hopene/tetraprenyl-beta-curcumene cyclase